MNVLQRIKDFFNRSRWNFLWRYLRGNTPWDTNVTPPEVEAFVSQTPAGRALDLGCGTGTNALALARRGWQVTGIDFIPGAIRKARRKAAGSGLAVEFLIADVTRLDGLTGPYDYVLDIGCLFAIDPEGRRNYLARLERLLRPGGMYMLYAWLPRDWEGRRVGLSEEQVHQLLDRAFIRERLERGEEKGHGSAWYWYRRK
ncbi:MAG: class I SAM-dependent methyltransferase [Desulfatitalea sp.]|nr:class I SAM-dependent methyltransferase [Desulfatitalea sp.]NNJ99672.1 class I SAM-dependent methyltransferase [Desulfatitalea sp.]